MGRLDGKAASLTPIQTESYSTMQYLVLFDKCLDLNSVFTVEPLSAVKTQQGGVLCLNKLML